ncbi:hypothetical protein B0H13DRAFT_2305193 [Mycena leptocephala]|nr:hypothetical protein B0H13DRAFT_2305193 [Mycena leptocephala]
MDGRVAGHIAELFPPAQLTVVSFVGRFNRVINRPPCLSTSLRSLSLSEPSDSLFPNHNQLLKFVTLPALRVLELCGSDSLKVLPAFLLCSGCIIAELAVPFVPPAARRDLTPCVHAAASQITTLHVDDVPDMLSHTARPTLFLRCLLAEQLLLPGLRHLSLRCYAQDIDHEVVIEFLRLRRTQPPTFSWDLLGAYKKRD